MSTGKMVEEDLPPDSNCKSCYGRGRKGLKHSEEAKKKMSKAAKRRRKNVA